jgi:hypothetical protein
LLAGSPSLRRMWQNVYNHAAKGGALVFGAVQAKTD